MGADARWVCIDCKTVCNRGGRPIVTRSGNDISMLEVDGIKENLATLKTLIDIEDDRYRSWMDFLDGLRKWLSRHEGHNIHIGSDYTTDMMDLDDYHNESVEGKVSSCTRYEARCKSVDEWEATARKEIGQIIRKHKDEIAHNNTDTVANELYQKFSTGQI